MNGFYRRQYDGTGIRQPSNGNGNDDNVLMMDAQQGSVGSAGMPVSQSLDEIVSRNSKEIQRGGVPVPFSSNGQQLEPDLRRMAMMDFAGTSSVSPLDVFSYDSSANTPIDGMMRPAASLSRHNSETQLNRQNISGHLALNTQIPDQNPQAFAGLGPSSSTFPSPLPVNPAIDLDMNSPYMASHLPTPMDLSDTAMNAMMNADPATVNFFPHPQFSTSIAAPQMRQNFANPAKANAMDISTPNANQKESFISNQSPQSANATQAQSLSPHDGNIMTTQAQNASNQVPSTQATNAQFKQNSISSEKASQSRLPNSMNEMKFSWTTPPGKFFSNSTALRLNMCLSDIYTGGFPSTMNNRPHTESQFKNAYSSTGFDMLGVLVGSTFHFYLSTIISLQFLSILTMAIDACSNQAKCGN